MANVKFLTRNVRSFIDISEGVRVLKTQLLIQIVSRSRFPGRHNESKNSRQVRSQRENRALFVTENLKPYILFIASFDSFDVAVKVGPKTDTANVCGKLTPFASKDLG